MRTLSEDTDPAVERMQMAIMARLPAWRKIELIGGMNGMISGLAIDGIRSRHPRVGAREVRYLLDEQRLGAPAARQLRAAREGKHDEYDEYEEGAYVAVDPVPVTLLAVAALDCLAIPYYLAGSIASGVHGVYRATADADIVAELREDQVDDLARLLDADFYADAEMMRDAIRHRSSFNLLHLATGFKVDVFVDRGRPFDRSRFEHRVSSPVTPSAEGGVYLSSAEGMVLAKLEWYREGGEVFDRQWYDIQGILKVRAAELDLPYLRHWADQLGIADLLTRALDDAGLG